MNQMESSDFKIEVEINPEDGISLRFEKASDLLKWNDDEKKEWDWLRERARSLFERHSQFHERIEREISHVMSLRVEPDAGVGQRISQFANEHFRSKQILYSQSVSGRFIKKILERSREEAASAYAYLLKAPIYSGGNPHPFPPENLKGVFEAWLFERNIDWSGATNSEVLDSLTSTYRKNIEEQERRFREIQNQNSVLIKEFSDNLRSHSEGLVSLHDTQIDEFNSLLETHTSRLEAIEKTYDQKLALQKPVRYWERKERYHGKWAKIFGGVSIVAGGVGAGLLGGLVYWVFGGLAPDKNPQHWQVGLALIGVFFFVWVIRVLVRLFFSNMHLATDASERRMMILTFLSMSREGAEFVQTDKSLIIQHLFRSASDGLVKDDAAPPSIFEMFSRTK